MKQVLIVRRDLGMRLGKSIAQGAHASLMAYRRTSLLKRIKWLLTGQTKIVVRADSEEQLLHLYQGAQDAGLTCVLVKDAGRTEFKEPTFTALGIGPDEPERLDPVTRKLELL